MSLEAAIQAQVESNNALASAIRELTAALQNRPAAAPAAEAPKAEKPAATKPAAAKAEKAATKQDPDRIMYCKVVPEDGTPISLLRITFAEYEELKEKHGDSIVVIDPETYNKLQAEATSHVPAKVRESENAAAPKAEKPAAAKPKAEKAPAAAAPVEITGQQLAVELREFMKPDDEEERNARKNWFKKVLASLNANKFDEVDASDYPKVKALLDKFNETGVLPSLEADEEDDLV